MSTRLSSPGGGGPLPPQVPGERPGPVGGKRDANRRARTQGLFDAATRLFLERGLQSVSIDDITKEAGIAKGSFYRYFADKEDLVRALLGPTRERVLSAFARAERKLLEADGAAATRSAYLRLGRELAVTLMGAPSIARLYLQESRAPGLEARLPMRELEREVVAAARRITEVALSHGLLRRVHPQVSSLTVIGAAERLLHAYLNGDLEVNPVTAMQDLVMIVLEGIRDA
jgi:AcrR family transcriptional regulator